MQICQSLFVYWLAQHSSTFQQSQLPVMAVGTAGITHELDSLMNVIQLTLSIGAFQWPLTQYYAYLLKPKLAIFTTTEIYFPTCVYPNPPCQLPYGRKPEHPERTHDFRQSVD